MTSAPPPDCSDASNYFRPPRLFRPSYGPELSGLPVQKEVSNLNSPMKQTRKVIATQLRGFVKFCPEIPKMFYSQVPIKQLGPNKQVGWTF